MKTTAAFLSLVALAAAEPLSQVKVAANQGMQRRADGSVRCLFQDSMMELFANTVDRLTLST